MCSECKLEITIETKTEEECMRIGTKIGNQLVGNKDYIDSNIVLNYTEGDNKVRLYICNDCEVIPEITI